MAEYKLSASLTAHENDVRGVLYPTSKLVLSASRDNTTRLWKLISENPPAYDSIISSRSGHWLNALTYLPPSKEYSEGLIISGGKDLIIEVRQPSKTPEDNAEALLLGHTNTICSLDVDPAGKFVVSGAWDNEARIWPVGKWECEAVLQGHEGSVWAVLAINSNNILTGCADQKIRVFHNSGKLLKSFQASKFPIRALCRVSNEHPSGGDFAAADNEGVIRFWTLSGDLVGEAHGHESFIYSLASLPSGEIVSSGEDRTLRIWKGTECVQTLTHPAISVWSIAVCADNGDIVSGASDRIVRVFSRSPERTADAETLQYFDEAVKTSSIPQQTMGDINKEKLPGPEFLAKKSGTKDGQVQMIREDNGSITAHTWSTLASQWTNVGTVVDAVGSSGQKEIYDGKEYDFVFSVDMEDGKSPLKLPYNLSENPYDAASKFIKNNNAPITYLDQVANFIIQNTQGATLDQGISAADAWGSENRYCPGESKPTATFAVPKILPQTEYLSIVVARVSAIHKKVTELNTALLAANKKDISLNPSELSVLASLCQKLENSSTAKATPPELELAVKIAITWPYKDRLPGLDLLRLLSVSSLAAAYDHPRRGRITDALIAGATGEQVPAENHIMMSIRAVANIFATREGRLLAIKDFEKIHSLISTSVASATNRNLLVAATTVYINYAVLFMTEPAIVNFVHVRGILEALGKVLDTQSDSEAVYRALVALGTLVSTDAEAKSAANNVYAAKEVVEKAGENASDPRIKNVAKEVMAALG